MPRSLSIPPENIRKPLGFLCFQGVRKEINNMKWVKVMRLPSFQTSWFFLIIIQEIT